ncbi:BTB/POZ domain-containing protein [Rhizophagus clarus]|uniref:BTB/POZ domain-containing protein n=1 Tax=Rhizophagus clarus TaxID=94130 RepID=A0A8H3L8J8_9GLOM|nr:BTB/POZ domain-containing protein [Rhizophagus clarus]
MTYNFESRLSEALGKLFEIETDYNVIIHIGKEPNVKEFHAHSNILRCTVDLNISTKYYPLKVLKKENILLRNQTFLLKFFTLFLSKYLYTDKVDIVNLSGTEILDFIIISDGLMLRKLTKFTEHFIIENHHQFLRNDPVGIIQTLYYCKAFINLLEFFMDKICSEPEILFNSDKFIQLSAPLLENILLRDDLNLNEIEIWEKLIKWGLAQEQSLDQDVSKWNKDDFNIFKRILYKFIPLIRFYEISSKDYFHKIKPYEKILSKKLRNNIIKYHMVPGYKPIYTPRHSKNFLKNNRDRNIAAAFHAKCDTTIVIVEVKNSNQIIGGYKFTLLGFKQ